jgi:hypothetical protein
MLVAPESVMGKGAPGKVPQKRGGCTHRTMGSFIRRFLKTCLIAEIPGQARNDAEDINLSFQSVG